MIYILGAFVKVYGSFLVGALRNAMGQTDQLWLYIMTTNPTSIAYTVEIDTGIVREGTPPVSNTHPAKVRMRTDFITLDSSFSNRKKGIIVEESLGPISVLVVNYRSSSVGEYLSYKNIAYGGVNYYQYYALSTGSTIKDSSSEILLVADSNDDTTVTIIPSQSITVPQDIQDSSSASMTVTSGTPFTVTLKRLQTFLFTAPLDLSGTSIRSDKPLTVISGHECGNVPSVCCCEHLTMQIPPTVTWGKEFLLTPYASRPAQYYKIIAAEQDTSIKYTCGNTGTFATITLANAGDVSQLQYSGSGIYCSLVSNKPVLVAQLGPGNAFGSNGDPVISMILPIEQYRTEATFISLELSDFTIHYINIAAKTKIMVEMDEQPLSLTWNTIYDSDGNIFGYGAQVSITVTNLASHTLSSVSEFSTLVYGFGSSTGYSYPAFPVSGFLRNLFTSSKYVFKF